MDPGGRQRETCRALCSEKDRPPAESTPATTAGAANGVCPARAEFTRLTQGSAPAGTVLRGGQVSARLFHRSSMSAGGRRGSPGRLRLATPSLFRRFPPRPRMSQGRLRRGDDAAAIL